MTDIVRLDDWDARPCEHLNKYPSNSSDSVFKILWFFIFVDGPQIDYVLNPVFVAQQHAFAAEAQSLSSLQTANVAISPLLIWTSFDLGTALGVQSFSHLTLYPFYGSFSRTNASKVVPGTQSNFLVTVRFGADPDSSSAGQQILFPPEQSESILQTSWSGINPVVPTVVTS